VPVWILFRLATLIERHGEARAALLPLRPSYAVPHQAAAK
jgi:hypothetical protein